MLAPICIGLLFVGLGIGFTWPHLVTGILTGAPATEHDLAAAEAVGSGAQTVAGFAQLILKDLAWSRMPTVSVRGAGVAVRGTLIALRQTFPCEPEPPPAPAAEPTRT